MRASISLRLGLIVAAALTALWPGAVATAGDAAADDDYGAAAAGCEVTEATPVMIPGAASPTWRVLSEGLGMPFGEQTTLAAVGPRDPEAPGTYPARWRHGRIEAKIPWFRERRARGVLRVKVRSLPGGERAEASYTNHLGRRAPVIPGGMSFPREGCWRVVGKSGDNTLRATVWVVSLTEKPD
jgi:hypothetical protein